MNFKKFVLLMAVGLISAFPLSGTAQAQVTTFQQLETLLHRSPETFEAFTPAQIQKLYTLARYNKIADPDKLDDSPYDPQRIIGYCFGRALAVQMIARQMGLKTDSIEKFFIIGPMKQKGEATVSWRFHVTTVVKGSDGRRWAIDPIFPHPMPIDQWAETVRSIYDSWNPDPNPLVHTKLYLTPPWAIMPDTRIFKADGQENGDRIIEVKFDPTNPKNIKTGFKAQTLNDLLYYEVDGPTTEQYWLHVDDAPGARQDTLFDLSGITINGEFISFHNFFTDLLNDLAEHPPKSIRSLSQAERSKAGHENEDESHERAGESMKAGECDRLMENPGGLFVPKKLGSIRFDRIVNGAP